MTEQGLVAPPHPASATLHDYQGWNETLHRRVNPGRHDRDHLANCVLGIVGELGEMFEVGADVVIEAGDVLSYLTTAAALVNMPIDYWLRDEQLDAPEEAAKYFHEFFAGQHMRYELETVRLALRLAELAKKEIFQGRSMASGTWGYLLSEIFYRVNTWSGLNGHSLRKVLEANIAKLTERYP